MKSEKAKESKKKLIRQILWKQGYENIQTDFHQQNFALSLSLSFCSCVVFRADMKIFGFTKIIYYSYTGIITRVSGEKRLCCVEH